MEDLQLVLGVQDFLASDYHMFFPDGDTNDIDDMHTYAYVNSLIQTATSYARSLLLLFLKIAFIVQGGLLNVSRSCNLCTM